MRSNAPPPSSVLSRAPFKLARQNNTNTNEPIAVIIGKTFESTTLPDGSQQINEVTKYKRLNDGYIYTESKLRNPIEEDKENVSHAASNAISRPMPTSAKNPSSTECGGFKLTQLNPLACHSSLTLTSSSETMSSNESNPAPLCGGGSYDSDSDHKGIFQCQTKETTGMSVVTEDYEEDSIEDYAYENEERRSLSPYAAARKENNLGGWCPSFDDIENKSLQLHQQSSVWSTWANDSVFGDNVLMAMFDRSNARNNNGNGQENMEEDSNERFHLKASRRMTCREMMSTKKCKVIMCFAAFLAAAIAVMVIAFQPSNEAEWNINKNTPTEPACIHLEIIIDTDTNPDGDVNEWSLVRHGKNDNLISIAKSSELSPDTVHNFQHCVQPGAFTFTVSDSGGDGLGTNGEGGYYIVANGVKLGVSSFFFHEDEMTFTLPFTGDEYDGDGETECADDFFLVIKTDANPEDVTWDVVDNDSGKTVMEGGPYELPHSVYTKRACMNNGNYTFNIKDGGEDGVCCDEGYGLYMLYNDGELIANSDGQYGGGASTVFMLGGNQ